MIPNIIYHITLSRHLIAGTNHPQTTARKHNNWFLTQTPLFSNHRSFSNNTIAAEIGEAPGAPRIFWVHHNTHS